MPLCVRKCREVQIYKKLRIFVINFEEFLIIQRLLEPNIKQIQPHVYLEIAFAHEIV